MVNIEIDNKLHEEMKLFCELNEIEDVNVFISECLVKGFDMEKYGDSFALFFNKEGSDIVRVEESIEEIVEVVEESLDEPVEEISVEESIEASVEQPVEVSVDTPIEEPIEEPKYEIKKEVKKETIKRPVTIIKKSPKDNYDVYD